MDEQNNNKSSLDSLVKNVGAMKEADPESARTVEGTGKILNSAPDPLSFSIGLTNELRTDMDTSDGVMKIVRSIQYKEADLSNERVLEAQVKSLKDANLRLMTDLLGCQKMLSETQNEVIRLNEEFSERCLGMVADHKDEMDRLKKELDDTTVKLNSMCNPSVTQVMSDSQTIQVLDMHAQLMMERKDKERVAGEKKKLEIENANLVKTMEVLEAVENYKDEEKGDEEESGHVDEKTPAVKKKRSKHTFQSSTITRGVKTRTMREERKSIDISPQIDTEDIVAQHDVGYNDPPLKLNNKCIAVKKTSKELKKTIQECWIKGGDSFIAWQSPDSMTVVKLQDIFMILQHQCISNGVIDSWGKMLHIKYSKILDTSRVVIFSSFRWGQPSWGLKAIVDNRLEKIGQRDMLLFPMITRDLKSKQQDDHWTLLKMDLSTCKWSFFNSISPRTEGVKNEHLERCVCVVNYVVRFLKSMYKKDGVNHLLIQTTELSPFAVPCMQQQPDSLDCGVIVCLNMENEMMGKICTKKELTHSAAGYFRKRMVEWFMDPDNVVVSKV